MNQSRHQKFKNKQLNYTKKQQQSFEGKEQPFRIRKKI